jgi:SAM-dependent methyltransferase
MTEGHADRVFSDDISRFYERYLVPLIFEPYAADLAQRVAALDVGRVLEIAAGTGVVTRQLTKVLPEHVDIVATDLNQAMLDTASEIGTARPVTWRQADVMDLPFPDASFDAVVCQFGVMFFPDKARAFAEMRRVLRPGATLLFNVWDRIEDNEFADDVTRALAGLFPDDPPRFLARTPHGHHDVEAVKAAVAAGGFEEQPDIDTVTARSVAASHRDPAIAYCEGTPLRKEIEARNGSLEHAVDVAAAEIARRFGEGPVDGKIQAHVVTVRS